jgi:hypothetical protein
MEGEIVLVVTATEERAIELCHLYRRMIPDQDILGEVRFKAVSPVTNDECVIPPMVCYDEWAWVGEKGD